MIHYDSEGQVRRSFWPHLALLALAAATAAADLAADGGWTARVARALIDPVNLLLAGVAGWWVMRHRQLLPALFALGLVIGFGLTATNIEALGATAPFDLVAVRLVACLLAGYAANAARLLLDPPASRV